MRFLVRRRSEVFITFMSNYIGRFMTDAHKAGLVDAIFATDEWRDLVGLSTTSQQTGAVQLYGKPAHCSPARCKSRLGLVLSEAYSSPWSTCQTTAT